MLEMQVAHRDGAGERRRQIGRQRIWFRLAGDV